MRLYRHTLEWIAHWKCYETEEHFDHVNETRKITEIMFRQPLISSRLKYSCNVSSSHLPYVNVNSINITK